MASSPHIWIAGLFATGGLSVLNSFHPANANKNLQASEISELTPSSLDAGTSELNSKNKEKVKSTNEYSPPMELELRADRQSYDARQKRYIAEGSVTATLNGAFLKADRIEFDRNFRTLLANGRVRFKKGGQYFQATSFSYSLIQKRGQLKDVYGVLDLESLDKDLKLLSDGKISTHSPLSADKGLKVSRNSHIKSAQIKTFQPRLKKILSGNVFEAERTARDKNQSIPPLNIWRSAGNYSLLFDRSNEENVDDFDIACPPLLPPIPELRPYPWSLTTWGGQMTDSDFGDAFIFNGDSRDENLFGIGLNKRFYRSGPLALEFEVDWFRHVAAKQAGGPYQSPAFADTPEQKFNEGVLAIGARVWLNSWLNVAFLEGISYNSADSYYEKTNRNKYSKLLNYLGAEIEAQITDRFSLVGRVHHRSGAFGTFGGVKGGSNAYLIGFRYRWGQSQVKKQLTVVPPPVGCSGSQSIRNNFPEPIDDSLAVFSIEKLKPISNVQTKENFSFKNEMKGIDWFSSSQISKLSVYEQQNLRYKLIDSIDQRIHQIKYRDSFAIQGKLGIQRTSSSTEEKNQPGSIEIPQLSPKARKQLVSGSITRWRVQAAKIILLPKGWKADRMSFTNDPFTPTQTRIEANNVVAQQEDNGDILITSSRSRLIVEERLSIPIVRSTRIRKSERVQNRWVLGMDQRDRDGLFIGRVMRPIALGDDYELSLQPQFLIQRSIQNRTRSYIAPGSSVTSSKVSSYTNAADLFGLRAKLRGESYGFGVNLDANISTFNSERFLDGSRYWGSLERKVNAPIFGQMDSTLFGTYRYKVWNGSIGEQEIYTAYGAFAEKSYDWNWGDLKNRYVFRYGLGNYQAETLVGGSLSELWRTNLYSSLKSTYILWQANDLPSFSEKSYRYSPIPITPGIAFNTDLSAAYFLYQDGSNQKVLSFTAGPTFTLGTFSKPFLDYTKFSIFAGGSLKDGTSPFAFDEVVDLGTLGVGLTQQIAGPLVLNTGFEFNIDGGSNYYGQAINSNIELRWQRRSYDLGLFYNPARGIGGISFHLNDFNFKGTGIPFMPYTPSQFNKNKLISGE